MARNVQRKNRPPKTARPTSGKVLLALFNILNAAGIAADARFLDLFSGTGAVARAALERGAASVTAVESDRGRAGEVAALLEKAGGERTICFCLDVRRALPKLVKSGKAYDVVFADPPYAMGWSEALPPLLWEYRAILAPGGAFVLERSIRDIPAEIPLARDDRIYGETVLSFYWQRPEGP